MHLLILDNFASAPYSVMMSVCSHLTLLAVEFHKDNIFLWDIMKERMLMLYLITFVHWTQLVVLEYGEEVWVQSLPSCTQTETIK